MAKFVTSECSLEQLQRLVVNSIVPRPIAFVSTISPDGVPNLAPFSFFSPSSYYPPTLAFSSGPREGASKDTPKYIENTGEFVVHIVSEDIARNMNESSAEVAPNVNEFELAGLTAVPSTIVKVPRVKEAKIAMECRLLNVTLIGEPPFQTHHIIGSIVCWHIDDSCITSHERFRIDIEKLKPVGRAGGVEYVRTTDRFAMPGPHLKG
jgi:flavin reductase (DIM6/NTAB) family NADH-FMN oxidoreductase RutF